MTQLHNKKHGCNTPKKAFALQKVQLLVPVLQPYKRAWNVLQPNEEILLTSDGEPIDFLRCQYTPTPKFLGWKIYPNLIILLILKKITLFNIIYKVIYFCRFLIQSFIHGSHILILTITTHLSEHLNHLSNHFDLLCGVHPQITLSSEHGPVTLISTASETATGSEHHPLELLPHSHWALNSWRPLQLTNFIKHPSFNGEKLTAMCQE